MVRLRKGMKRIINVLEEGPIEFDPVVGQLTTPPDSHYTGEIQIKIGRHDLILDRAEFLELAEKFKIIATLINGYANGSLSS